ncbi:MAG: tetratricopeptide repeat protein [Rhodospirillaceae bacterium]|nr:tetratricopeptide repeat protein [Rhodospirillaceae bacterium]
MMALQPPTGSTMRKLRYGAMALTIVVAVGAFLGAQRLDLIPGPWSKKKSLFGAESMGGIDAFSVEIAANPENYMHYYRRGTLFQKQRQYEKALADLDAAVRLSPTPLTVAALGSRAGDTTHSPTHTLGLVVLVRTTRAEILQQLNRPDEALADLDQALALDARKDDVQFARGHLRMVLGRYDDAISDFDKLLDKRHDVDWHFSRGVSKYLKSDWIGAIADFREAAHRAPRQDSYFIWLAKAHLRAGIIMDPQQFSALGSNGNARYVIEAFMSDHDSAQFIAGARAASAYAGRNGRCETTLFLGEWLVVRKKGKGARDLFHEALSACRPLSVEHTVAAFELRRLAAQ